MPSRANRYKRRILIGFTRGAQIHNAFLNVTYMEYNGIHDNSGYYNERNSYKLIDIQVPLV